MTACRLMLTALTVFMMCMFSASVQAEITPLGGKFDPRVRVIEYNATNVVRIATFYGVSTHVQFSDEENITDIAIGDDQAWNVVPRGNHLFVKPKAKNADTNVTVITNKRVYHFALVVAPHSSKDPKAWSDPELVYGLTFKYPEDITGQLAKKIVAESQAEEAERQKQALAAVAQAREEKLKNSLNEKGRFNQKKLLANKGQSIDVAASEVITSEDINSSEAAAPAMLNDNYWAAGSRELTPTTARDDGTFTYLTFTNNRDMPAVYSVDAAGKEALINTNVEGNTIIVHRVVPQIRLRKGDAVVCILNKSFDPDGGVDNTSGTVVNTIERITLEPNNASH